jgi:hypothetical protein
MLPRHCFRFDGNVGVRWDRQAHPETPDRSRLDEFFHGLLLKGNVSGNRPFSCADPASGAHRGTMDGSHPC